MDNLHKKVSSLSISQEKEDIPKDLKCPICQKKSSMTCSACKSVAYCCVEHQKSDWKNHKNACQPFVIKKTENMGLGWFATRDLKDNVLLLEELPDIQAPSWMDTESNTIKKCTTCGAKIHRKKTTTCSTCSWPVCSEQCEKNPLHLDNECKELAHRKLQYPLRPNWPSGMLTMCMRANALKARDPQKFKQLMALQDYFTLPLENQELQKTDLPPGMFQVLSGPNSLDRGEFRKLLRIFKVNAIDDIWSQEFNVPIYLKTSRMNHSCFSNCVSAIGPAPDHKIRIRTATPIAKGQELTLNYGDLKGPGFGFQSTWHRQKYLREIGFICKCKRCLDPTELGTFMTGIKCCNCSSHLRADCDSAENSVGFMIAADPLDNDYLGRIFECHRCHVQLSFDQAMKTLPAALNIFLVNLGMLTLSKPVDQKSLDTLVTQYEKDPVFKGYLHKNHALIQSSMRMLAEAQVKNLDTMTRRQLLRLVKRVEHLLTIDDIIYPGHMFYSRFEDLNLLSKPVQLLRFNDYEFTGMPDENVIKLARTFHKVEIDRLEFITREENKSPEEKLKFDKDLKLMKEMKEQFEEAIKHAEPSL